MAAKVKAASNMEDGHSFWLCNEGAISVGKSQGFGEDGVEWIFSLNHIGAGSLFITFGRARPKKTEHCDWECQGGGSGGGLVVLANQDTP